MKKVKSRRRSAGSKKRRTPATLEDYFARVPQPARQALSKIRAAIRSVVPAGSTEVISYGIPAFKHEKVLVWYAAFSDHCSLFPTGSIIEAFREELSGYSTAKGTVHFPLDKPMPTTLIKRMVKGRVAESGSKKAR